MEGEAFLEECIALKEGMDKMKGNYMNLLSGKNNLFMWMKCTIVHSRRKKRNKKNSLISWRSPLTY